MVTQSQILGRGSQIVLRLRNGPVRAGAQGEITPRLSSLEYITTDLVTALKRSDRNYFNVFPSFPRNQFDHGFNGFTAITKIILFK